MRLCGFVEAGSSSTGKKIFTCSGDYIITVILRPTYVGAAVNAGVNADVPAADLTVAAASKGTKLDGQTTATVDGGVSSVAGFAVGTAGDESNKSVDTTKSVVGYTAAATHNEAKKVLPVGVVDRTEQAYEADSQAAAQPLEAAVDINLDNWQIVELFSEFDLWYRHIPTDTLRHSSPLSSEDHLTLFRKYLEIKQAVDIINSFDV